MSKTKVSRRNDVARFLRMAELEATDERSHQECMSEMTDPNIIGLSPQDALVVSNAIRSDMLRRIMAEDDTEDEENLVPEDETMIEETESPKGSEEEEEEEEDVVEFEDDEKPEDGPDDVKFGEDFGFPSDEEEDIPAESEEDILPMQPQIGEEISPTDEFDGEFEDDFGGEFGDEFGIEGDVIPIDPNGSVTLALPDGSTMELSLTQEVVAAIKHQKEVEAMSRERMTENQQLSMEEFKQRRSAQRQALRQIIAAQQEPEDIAPSSDKPLGDDTSHSGDGKGGGKTFQMQDGTHGVANVGDTQVHPTMTMSNSEGNSLRNDPGFAANKIYTRLPADLMMNANAKDLARFTSEPSNSIFTRTIDGSDTPDPIPTTGMGTDAMGWDKGFESFNVPTQLDSTTQRFPIVAQASSREWERRVVNAAMNRECMGCDDPQGHVEPLQCEDCGSVYALCEACVSDEHCPTCASRNAENARYNSREAGLNWPAYCGTPKDRQEVCEDTRGDDPNGDGGFRTQDKMGRAPKGKNARDMNVDAGQFEKEASRKVDELARQNQALHIQMARLVKATEVANEMVANGQMAPDEVSPQIDKWMADGMTIPALENFRVFSQRMGNRDFQTRLSEAGREEMTRTASPQRIRAASLPFNPNPTREAAALGGDLTEALSEMMKSSLPSKEDFDERTGVRLR